MKQKEFDSLCQRVMDSANSHYERQFALAKKIATPLYQLTHSENDIMRDTNEYTRGYMKGVERTLSQFARELNLKYHRPK